MESSEQSWWIGLDRPQLSRAVATRRFDDGQVWGKYSHIEKRPREQSAERRQQIAKKGAAARWGTRRGVA